MTLRAFFLLAAIFVPHLARAMDPIVGPLALAPSHNIQSWTFASCESGASYRLVLINGPNNTPRVSRVLVRINNIWVVSSNDFGEQNDQLERVFTPLAQNTIEVKILGSDEARASVAIECAGGCLDITLAPLPSELVAEQLFVVRGSLLGAGAGSGPGPIGVAINGSPAEVTGDQFTGTARPLLGLSTLSVIATNTCGHRASSEFTVLGSPPTESSAWLQTSPAPRGLAPLELTLKVRSIEAPASISWDFDGDGIEDAATTENSVVANYPGAGVFVATARVTSAIGELAETSAVIRVDTPETLAPILQPIWDQFVFALASGDVAAASALAEGKRQHVVRAALESVRPDLLAISSALQGTLAITEVRNRRAFAVLAAAPPTRPEDIPIVFHVDTDGRWRIQSP
jgi:hypothetical protein